MRGCVRELTCSRWPCGQEGGLVNEGNFNEKQERKEKRKQKVARLPHAKSSLFLRQFGAERVPRFLDLLVWIR
jgi:hypothetical protein